MNQIKEVSLLRIDSMNLWFCSWMHNNGNDMTNVFKENVIMVDHNLSCRVQCHHGTLDLWEKCYWEMSKVVGLISSGHMIIPELKIPCSISVPISSFKGREKAAWGSYKWRLTKSIVWLFISAFLSFQLILYSHTHTTLSLLVIYPNSFPVYTRIHVIIKLFAFIKKLINICLHCPLSTRISSSLLEMFLSNETRSDETDHVSVNLHQLQ
jgi:hypothetical protein